MSPEDIGQRYGARVSPAASPRRVIREIRTAIAPETRRVRRFREARHWAYLVGLAAHLRQQHP